MSKLPETGPSLLRYLRAQKRQVTRMANATPYALSGTSVTAPGLTKVDDRIVAGTAGGSRVELDSAGLRKYAADGTTVQVDLTGDVAAFSGLITGSEIVGGVLKTAASGARVEIVPVDVPTPGGTVRFYSGGVDETYPAEIWAGSYGQALDYGYVEIISPSIAGSTQAELVLTTGPTHADIGIYADKVYINPSDVDETLTWIGGGELATNVTTLETGWGITGSPCLMRRIFVVADATVRAALVAAYIAAPRSRVIDSAHPLFIWKADEAPGAQLQSTVDGTTFVTIGGGGSGTTLFADPNADRLVFWDDSAGAFAPLTASTGLTLTGTDLTVRDATDAQTGIAELATSAEAVTGTDTVRAVTPAGVKAAVYAIGASTGASYSAGWADYGGSPGYVTWYKDKDGFIRLGGVCKRTGATITAGASGTIFTLPVGARPSGFESFAVNKDGALVFLTIDYTGVVQVDSAQTWTSGSSYLYTSGVMFKAA